MARVRMTGHLGMNPEENFGVTGKRSVNFRMCVNTYDEGPVWYDVAGGQDLADFALQKLEKGNRVTVTGEQDVKPYTDNQGQSRLRRFLRALMLELPTGERAGSTLGLVETPQATQNAEKLREERHKADLALYPPRWERPGFFERNAVAAKAREIDPEAWDEDAELPDSVPQDAVRALIRRLSAV